MQYAGLDPKSVILSKFDRFRDSINAVLNNPSNPHAALREGAYRSISSLCFVVPDIAVPIYVTDVLDALDPDTLSWIGTFETGVWRTPVGLTFVDGKLASQLTCSSCDVFAKSL